MTDYLKRRPQAIIAVCVFLVVLGIYNLTLSPTLSFWDSGEFITASHIVGVPHQPGTPSYVLVGRVFDVLLGNGDVTEVSLGTARAINFMSAFFSALAAMLVYLIIFEIARRSDPDSGWRKHLGGVVGALFLALSDSFWINAIEAEVYGLSAFIMALVAWLSLRWYEHRQSAGSNQLLLLMVYILGLGVGFHLGSLLVYPGIFLLVLLAPQRHLPIADLLLMSFGLAVFLFSTTTKNDSVVIMLALLFTAAALLRAFQGNRFALYGGLLFCAGLSVHLILMVRAGASPEPLINQTDPDNFSTLMSVIRREQYPPINPFERRAPIMWQYGYYYRYLLDQFYFLNTSSDLLKTISVIVGPIALAVIGLFHSWKRVRILILVPLVGYLINGEILTFYLNFTNHEVRDRDYFYFAAFLFFSIMIGLGAAAIMRLISGRCGSTADELIDRGEQWKRGVVAKKADVVVWSVGGVLLLISLLPLMPGHIKLFEHDRHDNHIASEYARNILATVDKDGILFTNGDNDTFPIWYLQAVEHYRTDVTVVNLMLINMPWYAKQLKHGEVSLGMTNTDTQIEELRHSRFQDPETGKTTIYLIKDFVVHDILTTNFRTPDPRPVFFAITIPRENMANYYDYLQMEGFAYRMTRTRSEDGEPVIAEDKVLENILGRYNLDTLTDGDSAARLKLYTEMTGTFPDLGIPQHKERPPLSVAQVQQLEAQVGKTRRDVFFNINTQHLLGNYPTSLNRASFDYYRRAAAEVEADTTIYRYNMRKAIEAVETSLALSPYNNGASEVYASWLVSDFRDNEARQFLSDVMHDLPNSTGEQIVYNNLVSIARMGLGQLVMDWLDAQLEIDPDRKFYYTGKLAMYQSAGALDKATEVVKLWKDRSGEEAPEMDDALRNMANRSSGGLESPSGTN